MNTDDQQNPQTGLISIRSILTEDGAPLVGMQILDSKLAIVPDAAIEIAYNLLGAAYASKAEQLLYQYATTHGIDPQSLIEQSREQERRDN